MISGITYSSGKNIAAKVSVMIALPKPVAVPIRYAPKTMKAKMAMGASFHFTKIGVKCSIKITLFGAFVNVFAASPAVGSQPACLTESSIDSRRAS
ncbi:MAG TPA: hypothetical protein PKW95_07995 [bacterium]|nr:hypothetical protein [bacterium]